MSLKKIIKTSQGLLVLPYVTVNDQQAIHTPKITGSSSCRNTKHNREQCVTALRQKVEVRGKKHRRTTAERHAAGGLSVTGILFFFNRAVTEELKMTI